MSLVRINFGNTYCQHIQCTIIIGPSRDVVTVVLSHAEVMWNLKGTPDVKPAYAVGVLLPRYILLRIVLSLNQRLSGAYFEPFYLPRYLSRKGNRV